MNQFGDERTLILYQNGTHPRLPKRVWRRAHRTLQLLLASHSLQDVGVTGPITVWAEHPGRLGLHIEGKWYITFRWDPSYGAHEITIQRCQVAFVSSTRNERAADPSGGGAS